MFDFLHSILKWQFLNRIQIDLTLYLQFCDRNGSHKCYHTFRVEYKYKLIRAVQLLLQAQLKQLQSYCADNWVVWFVPQASAHKSI